MLQCSSGRSLNSTVLNKYILFWDWLSFFVLPHCIPSWSFIGQSLPAVLESTLRSKERSGLEEEKLLKSQKRIFKFFFFWKGRDRQERKLWADTLVPKQEGEE